jgi:hypothetical protein
MSAIVKISAVATSTPFKDAMLFLEKTALWQNLWVKRGKTPLDFDRRVARAEAQKPPLCSF